MTTQTVEAVTTLEAVEECRHHWVIESAHGPTSNGVCRRCGQEKSFFNAAPDLPWEEDSPQSQRNFRAA